MGEPSKNGRGGSSGTVISLPQSLTALIFALVLTATGQILFRMHYQRTGHLYLAAALGTFAIVPLLIYFALLNLTLALVYMSTALVHVLVLIMSRLVLGEQLVKRHYLAIMLITAGIIVFNL